MTPLTETTMTPPVIVDPNMSFHVFVSLGIEGIMTECVSEKNWDSIESIAHWATIDPRENKEARGDPLDESHHHNQLNTCNFP